MVWSSVLTGQIPSRSSSVLSVESGSLQPTRSQRGESGRNNRSEAVRGALTPFRPRPEPCVLPLSLAGWLHEILPQLTQRFECVGDYANLSHHYLSRTAHAGFERTGLSLDSDFMIGDLHECVEDVRV